METVGIYKAKATLSGLVASVEHSGERVILCRYGKPVAEIVFGHKRKRSVPNPKLSPLLHSGDLTAPTLEEWDNT